MPASSPAFAGRPPRSTDQPTTRSRRLDAAGVRRPSPGQHAPHPTVATALWAPDTAPASGAPVPRQRPAANPRSWGQVPAYQADHRIVAQPGSPDVGPREPRAAPNDRGPQPGPTEGHDALDKRHAISEREGANRGVALRALRDRPAG